MCSCDLAQGKLTVTSEDVTDYDYITNDLMRYSEHLLISKIGYDKYNATQWAIDATSLGLPLEEYSQSLGNFNMPTRELERQILSGNVIIDTNEITLNCFRNVKLKYDHNGNCKPDKGLGISKKIDGVISMIQALGVYLVTPQYGFSI